MGVGLEFVFGFWPLGFSVLGQSLVQLFVWWLMFMQLHCFQCRQIRDDLRMWRVFVVAFQRFSRTPTNICSTCG